MKAAQLLEEHYVRGYDHLGKWMLYWEQIQTVLSLPNSKRVLIVGPGMGVVEHYLRQVGYVVDTVDVLASLRPTYVLDVRNLGLVGQKYDVVVVSHILEHIPFLDVPRAIRELRSVAKQYVLFSGPHWALFFEGRIHLHGKYVNWNWRIPLPFVAHRLGTEHEWELGKQGYDVKTFEEWWRTGGFVLVKEWRPPLNAWSHYYLWKVKQ